MVAGESGQSESGKSGNGELAGLRVAALVDDHFEEVELTEPKRALERAGARVDIISRRERLTAMRHDHPGDEFRRDVALDRARPEDYDALLLPGGVMNGDSLRIVPAAQQFARAMVDTGKPLAVICHGGWLLISAGLARGRTLTSWPTLQDDYRNAGAKWVDEPVVVDNDWVSSRKPDDIPAFVRETIRVFAQHGRQERAA